MAMSKQLPIVYTMQHTMLFLLYSFLTRMKLALIMGNSNVWDRHILDMETEVLPLVKPAKELIDLVSEMTKK